MSQIIKIYTTPFCPYCELAKKFFKEHNLEYQEINVADDDIAREELIAKTYFNSWRFNFFKGIFGKAGKNYSFAKLIFLGF